MKRKLLVFEGVDGSGKTSIAKEVAKLLEAKYQHTDKFNTMQEGMVASYDFAYEGGENKVMDRMFHSGECVYAPIYRGYDGYGYIEDLENEMLLHNEVFMIYVTASNETLLKRIRERGEDYIKEEHIQTIKDNYGKFLSTTKIPYVLVDTTEGTLQDNVEQAFDKVYDIIFATKCNGNCIDCPQD